jgi:Fe2+ or Zn2+ uptake regulation protein
MDTDLLDPVAALRRGGLRVTAPRLAVLRALAAGAPHASVDAIVGAVRDRLGESSAQTVYNVLRTFGDVGLVRRIEPAGQPGLYELRVGDNHHHVICRSCGAVADVTCAVGEAPCLTAAETAGYDIDEAEVIYWGRCPACVAAGAAATPSGSSDEAVTSDEPLQLPSVGHHLNEATRHGTQRNPDARDAESSEANSRRGEDPRV